MLIYLGKTSVDLCDTGNFSRILIILNVKEHTSFGFVADINPTGKDHNAREPELAAAAPALVAAAEVVPTFFSKLSNKHKNCRKKQLIPILIRTP